MKTIYLDLDGVCCDFLTASLKTLNKEDVILNWPSGAFDIEKAVGISRKDFSNIMDSYDSNFWRNLEEYPWFWELYKTLKNIGDVIFCTKPATSSQSVKGKLEWLQDRFGKDFREYVFIDKKYYLANPNSLLIDDDERQTEPFKNHGGEAILFPQIWNTNYPYRNYGLEYVFNLLKKGNILV